MSLSDEIITCRFGNDMIGKHVTSQHIRAEDVREAVRALKESFVKDESCHNSLHSWLFKHIDEIFGEKLI